MTDAKYGNLISRLFVSQTVFTRTSLLDVTVAKMADKEKCITELSSFLTETARKVESILQKLNWKKETLLKEVFKNQQNRDITLVMRTKATVNSNVVSVLYLTKG